MKVKKVLISMAAFGLLLGGLIGCGKENQPSSKPSSKPSNPSTSQIPVHEHNWGTASAAVKNADGKDVVYKDCVDGDARCISIAFKDYSEKSADFGDNSGYNNVPAEIRNETFLLAKNSNISWKINVDKAITGAKIAFGGVYTGNDHGDQALASKYTARVNDADFANWELDSSVTYDSAGLSQTQISYVVALTADLVAGENTISLGQLNGGYRLLFGGEVRIIYSGDAVPVAAPATGYDVTFVPAHCKILVYEGENFTKDPVETNKAQTMDKEGNLVKYVAPDENGEGEIKPEICFKVVADTGYYVDGNMITVSGTMGNEWNKVCTEDAADVYSVTKIKANITITVTAQEGEQTDAYTANVTAEHCTVVFYLGKKASDGSNIDEGAAGKYNSRTSAGAVSKTKAQFNFEVIPDEGYEFVTNLEKGSETSPIGISFVTGRNGALPYYGNFKVDKNNAMLFSITKVASYLDINIVCTLIAA